MAFSAVDILEEFAESAMLGRKLPFNATGGQGGMSIVWGNERRKAWRLANQAHVRRVARSKYLRNRNNALVYQRWYYETHLKQPRYEARVMARALKASLPPVPPKPRRSYVADYNMCLTITALIGLGLGKRATAMVVGVSDSCVRKVVTRGTLHGRGVCHMTGSQRRRERGVCYRCGRPPVPERTRCVTCAAKDRAYMLARKAAASEA